MCNHTYRQRRVALFRASQPAEAEAANRGRGGERIRSGRHPAEGGTDGSQQRPKRQAVAAAAGVQPGSRTYQPVFLELVLRRVGRRARRHLLHVNVESHVEHR